MKLQTENGSQILSFLVCIFRYSKHTTANDIKHSIDTFAEYYNAKVLQNTYVILNDINLGCGYGGGRDHFDTLLSKLNNSQYSKLTFAMIMLPVNTIQEDIHTVKNYLTIKIFLI